MAILLLVYEAWMTALGVLVFACDGWNVIAWAGIGLTATAAVVVGAVRNAPLRRAPWFILAAALLAATVGDTALALASGQSQELLTMASVCYFAVLPLTLASLTLLTRTSVVLGDRSRMLDILAVVCAAVVAAWVFLVGPGLKAARLSGEDRALLALCVVGDLLMLIVMLRLVMSAYQVWSVILLATGATGALVGDIAYGAIQVYGTWRPGGVSEAAYVVFYLCIGAAALHPSMADLTRPVSTRPGELPCGVTALLRVSLAVPAITLLIQVFLGDIHDLVVIAVGSIIMGQLVIVRLSDTIDRHRRSAARERVLRETCGELVSTVDVQQAVDIVHRAVDRLMPPGAAHEVVISVRSAVDLLETPEDGRMTRLVPTASLRPSFRARMGGHESALVCPLVIDLCSRDDAGQGVLCAAAHPRVLESMRDAVEVLAAQLCLALERMTLSDVINQRDGDRYLRTVVQNTADIVLIVEDDYRIRYASPSLTSLLGVDPSVCATLLDLVHGDDHAQVAETRVRSIESTEPLGVRGMWNLRRSDGYRVLVEVNFRDLRKDRMVRGFVITMRDVSDYREREQESIRRALESTGGWQNRKSSMNRFR